MLLHSVVDGWQLEAGEKLNVIETGDNDVMESILAGNTNVCHRFTISHKMQVKRGLVFHIVSIE